MARRILPTFAAVQPPPLITTYILPTFAGLEPYLAQEAEALGAQRVEAHRRVVYCQGDKAFRYRANLHLRTGIRVLEEVAYFQVRNERDLYARLREVDWGKYLDASGSLWIDTVTQHEGMRNGVYLSQRFKDAVVDQFRERHGQRPDVSKDDASLYLYLHLDREGYASVSLNSSGPGLHRRGYRKRTGGAPLNEVLAAGMLVIAGYDGSVPFVDPMCGSGTIAVEAALIASRRAPGLERSFNFERWPDFEAAEWSGIRQEALDALTPPSHPILAADQDELTVQIAKVTLERAKVLQYVTCQTRKFAQLQRPAQRPLPERERQGLIVTNPPYEMRLQTGDIEGLYERIGDTLKQNWAGYSAWLISANFDALKKVGLRTSKKVALMNGPLPVKYCRYDLYQGSRK